jgi:cytochrome c peroxidase
VTPIGPQLPESEIRRGERLFNDGSIAFQGWLSCSTCHPDGRSDGLNWDLSNDGIGNPKNAKSLLLSHKTPPLMWTGLFATLDDCVPFEVRTILFSARPPHDSAAIAAYLSSLKPTPSPFLEKGELTESAKRGEAVTQKAGCDECHRGEFLTAREKRSVGVYPPVIPASSIFQPGEKSGGPLRISTTAALDQ